MTVKVCAVDPGVTTGFCCGVRSDSHFELSEYEEITVLQMNVPVGGGGGFEGGLGRLGELVRKATTYEPGRGHKSVLVLESFVAYPGKIHTAQTAWSGFSPIFVTGWLLGYLAKSRRAVEVVYQGAGDAKKVITNDRLRSLGLYVRGSDHVRDAVRHAELYCRREFMRERGGRERDV